MLAGIGSFVAGGIQIASACPVISAGTTALAALA
jgi:hypothetical protein